MRNTRSFLRQLILGLEINSIWYWTTRPISGFNSNLREKNDDIFPTLRANLVASGLRLLC